MKKFRMLLSILILASLMGLYLPAASAQTMLRCYVKADAIGTNTGDSWENAYTDLQSALGTSPCTEIWVAAGTYTPGIYRTDTFALKNGVAIYGGFNGTEEQFSERDVNANVTILSGERTPGDWYQLDNTYHIVSGGGTNNTAILDGFTITKGYANNYHEYPPPPTEYGYGSGIYNVNGSPTLTNLIISSNQAGYGGGIYNGSNSNPFIANTLFIGNKADHLYGGGMYNGDSNPHLQNVTFSGNHAGHGGGMYNTNSSPYLSNVTFYSNDESGTFTSFGGGMCNENNSNAILEKVIFDSNTSRYGGALYNNYSSPWLTDVTFVGNKAHQQGGGMLNTNNSNPRLMMVTFNNNKAWLIQPEPGYEEGDGGGMYNSGYSSPKLANVTFYGNTAVNGSAIYNYNASPILRNTTIARNSDAWGAEIYIGGSGSFFTIRNSIFSGGLIQISEGTPPVVITDSLIYYGCPNQATCSGNTLEGDPLLGELGNNGGSTQTMALEPDSPAIDAGNNATCAATDQRGVARPQGAACDMGAYEVDVPPEVKSIASADPNPTSKNTVRFDVTFSEPVQNVNTSDFALTTSGTMEASSITEVSGSDADYTVSVETASGNGTIRLDVKEATDIQDLTGNNLVGGFTAGDIYTVKKRLTLRTQSSYDGYIWESSETSGIGLRGDNTGTTLSLGDDNVNRQYRAILSFSTAALPDNAVITQVTLRIKHSATIGISPFTTHGELKVDIRNPYFGTAAILAPSDFQAATSKPGIGTFGITAVNDWYTAVLESISYPYINLSGTTQFRLRFQLDDNDDMSADYAKFFSGNYAVSSYRPTIVVDYYVP